jgi:hypothetical protein
MGCADKSFNLPFTMSQANAAFLNYPHEGGERNNRLQFIFLNNDLKNCSCERAGALGIINYNYITIANCTFEDSRALDYGGALFVVSTNMVIIKFFYFKALEFQNKHYLFRERFAVLFYKCGYPI